MTVRDLFLHLGTIIHMSRSIIARSPLLSLRCKGTATFQDGAGNCKKENCMTFYNNIHTWWPLPLRAIDVTAPSTFIDLNRKDNTTNTCIVVTAWCLFRPTCTLYMFVCPQVPANMQTP